MKTTTRLTLCLSVLLALTCAACAGGGDVASGDTDSNNASTNGATATNNATTSANGSTNNASSNNASTNAATSTNNGSTSVACPPTACQPGEVACDGVDMVVFCEAGGDGCGVFVADQTCTDGQQCANGLCVGGCIDSDGDLHGENCAPGPDCDDSNPDRYNGADEVCDGLDNDCNGQVDDGGACDVDCSDQPCAPGDRMCSGDSALSLCRADPLTGCGVWEEPAPCDSGACQNDACVGCIDNDGDQRGTNCPFGPDCDDTDANVYPDNVELCDGLDNNCNGLTDETFPELGQACSAGVGVCAGDGVYGCAAGGMSVTCNAAANPPSEEVCGDGQDNDCDGQTDEGFPTLGDSCADGLGACRREGAFVCDGTGVRCTAQAAAPGSETCGDGIDNDCDGQADEECGCVEDGNEPNNSSNTATNLPRGASSSGTLCGANTRPDPNNPDPEYPDPGPHNIDWFNLGTFSAGQTITVDIEYNNPQVSMHMEFYTSTFKTASANQSGGHQLTFVANETANYSVMVWAGLNGLTGTPYTIHNR